MSHTKNPHISLQIESVLHGPAVVNAMPRSSTRRWPSLSRRVVLEAEESYRKAALFLSKIVANGGRAVLFCSARRGEGTTTAVLNVAHQLQDSYGLRPLVVELNRRRPALAKLFALDPARSLEAALDQSRPAVECIQVTASGLSIMSGGDRSAGHPHPRLAAGLTRVLSEVESLFDVVLLDAPPILSQADAVIAGAVVPTVILVVESGRTNYEVLERVKRELATEDIKIAGSVLVKQERLLPRWLQWWGS